MKKKTLEFIKSNKVSLITIVILILIIGVSVYLTYAFYTDSDTKNLISGQVGYFENPDLSINYMVEDRNDSGVGLGTYTAYWVAPSYNYAYNAGTSYCTNDATFTKTDEDVFTVTTGGKTKCYFYYDAVDLTSDADIKIIVMREAPGHQDEDENGYIVASNYKTIGFANDGYIYNPELTNCTNGGNVTFNEETEQIEVDATGKTTCTVYFKLE